MGYHITGSRRGSHLLVLFSVVAILGSVLLSSSLTGVEDPAGAAPRRRETTTSTDVLWSASHDGGTTNEWSSGGGGGLYNSGSYEAVASTDQHHSGSHSLRAKIWTPSSPESGVRAFRWAEPRANRSLFYSAWVYLPQNLQPTGNYLNLFQFKSRTADGSRNDPLWGFYGAPDGNGGVYLKAGWGWGGTPLAGPRSGDGVSGKWFEPSQKVSIPVGRWVHLQASLNQSNQFDGHLQVWQDGAKLFDLANIRTSYTNCNFNMWCANNEWSVNLNSDALAAKPATMYIDDAVISRTYVPGSGSSGSSTTSTSAPSSTSSTSPTTSPTTTSPTTAPPTTTTTVAPAPAPTPALLWSAGQDGGNLNEWSANGGGGLYNSGSYEAVASTDQRLDGSHSLRARIWMPSSPTSGVRAFRWAEARANREAYYSTWIYLPQKLDPSASFLNLFQFKSRSADNSRMDPVWGFYGAPDGNGGTYLKAGWGWGGTPLAGPRSSDGVSGKWFEPSQKVSLPVGRWVHLEAFLRQSKDFDGQLQLWQDGVKIIDLANIRTSFANCNFNSWCASNEWSVNLYADSLQPNPATIYIDKSAIARSYIP